MNDFEFIQISLNSLFVGIFNARRAIANNGLYLLTNPAC